MSAAIDLNGVLLTSDGANISLTTNLKTTATPTDPTDMATKGYIDTILGSATPKIQIYMIDNATATVIAAANTPVKALGTTTVLSTPLSVNAVDFDMPASNRVRYTGADTIVIGVNIAATVISANNNQNYAGYLYKNGSNVGSGFKQEGSIATATTIRSGYNAYGFIEMATNDYLEFFIENQTAGNNLTIRQLQITVGTI